VEARGFSVTVGDAAASAGVKVPEAQVALNALAHDTGAHLIVTTDGDILYEFPRDMRSRVASKSLRIRAEPALRKAGQAAFYLGRVSFGMALLASTLVSTTAVLALLLAKGDSNDTRGRRSSGVHLSGGDLHAVVRLIDIWTWFDPYYAYRGYLRPPSEMGFFESVGSFLWGDGDPNREYDQRRWAACGEYIQSRGGVVAPEELAQFASVTDSQLQEALRTGDTGYATEALVRFRGEPVVDADGNLLLTFPELQVTEGWDRKGRVPTARLELEATRQLTRATTGQRIGAVALGVWNLVMVATLSKLLVNPAAVYSVGPETVRFLFMATPFLQVFAVGFFIVPVVRWAMLLRANRAIEERNRARRLGAQLLQSGKLDAKMAAATRAALQAVKIVREQRTAFRTDAEVSGQRTEFEDWDRRLKSSSAGAGRGPEPSAPPKPRSREDAARYPDVFMGSDPEPSAPPMPRRRQ